MDDITEYSAPSRRTPSLAKTSATTTQNTPQQLHDVQSPNTSTARKKLQMNAIGKNDQPNHRAWPLALRACLFILVAAAITAVALVSTGTLPFAGFAAGAPEEVTRRGVYSPRLSIRRDSFACTGADLYFNEETGYCVCDDDGGALRTVGFGGPEFTKDEPRVDLGDAVCFPCPARVTDENGAPLFYACQVTGECCNPRISSNEKGSTSAAILTKARADDNMACTDLYPNAAAFFNPVTGFCNTLFQGKVLTKDGIGDCPTQTVSVQITGTETQEREVFICQQSGDCCGNRALVNTANLGDVGAFVALFDNAKLATTAVLDLIYVNAYPEQRIDPQEQVEQAASLNDAFTNGITALAPLTAQALGLDPNDGQQVQYAAAVASSILLRESRARLVDEQCVGTSCACFELPSYFISADSALAQPPPTPLDLTTCPVQDGWFFDPFYPISGPSASLQKINWYFYTGDYYSSVSTLDPTTDPPTFESPEDIFPCFGQACTQEFWNDTIVDLPGMRPKDVDVAWAVVQLFTVDDVFSAASGDGDRYPVMVIYTINDDPQSSFYSYRVQFRLNETQIDEIIAASVVDDDNDCGLTGVASNQKQILPLNILLYSCVDRDNQCQAPNLGRLGSQVPSNLRFQLQSIAPLSEDQTSNGFNSNQFACRQSLAAEPSFLCENSLAESNYRNTPISEIALGTNSGQDFGLQFTLLQTGIRFKASAKNNQVIDYSCAP